MTHFPQSPGCLCLFSFPGNIRQSYPGLGDPGSEAVQYGGVGRLELERKRSSGWVTWKMVSVEVGGYTGEPSRSPVSN